MFSISKQFSNYYEYHKNPINQFIHFIFVPSIVFGIILFLTKFPIHSNVPILTELSKTYSSFTPTVALYLLFPLCCYYLILDFGIGMVLFFQFFSFFLISNYISFLPYVKNNFTFVCIVIQVISWGFQFIGHGVFEGRRPALIDNIFQTLIAPMFVMVEYFIMFGLRNDLKETLMKDNKEKIKSN